MGFTPDEVDAMSLWQFVACADGYAEAHGGKKRRASQSEISDAKLRAMGVEGF